MATEPETVDQAAEPQSDLWTADSERAAIQTSDPVVPGDPADTEAQAPPLEAPADSHPDDASPESPDRDDKGQFKPKKKPRDNPDARIKDATAKEARAKEEARLIAEENARLKAELEAARRPAPGPGAPVPQPTAAPKFAFPTFADYLTQHPDADWETYQDAKLDARDAWREGMQQARQRLSGHQERYAQAVTADPSFKSLVDAGLAQIQVGLAQRGLNDLPDVVGEAVMASPRSVDLLRHLVTHADEAIQLALDVREMPSSAAAVNVVRRLLEASLTTGAVARPDAASPVVRPSAAKPPIHRVGGTATVVPADPEDLEFGPEYIRRENQREKQQREAGRW